ncbi:GNAT family protein [Rhodococcus sp. 14-2483-1-2]|uniref:GNAT family N-acetyltransferase n=1 Tax=Rhodococcus sp. 14-2483-1-2 TaxID=2023147 RepID=UPI000B9C6064|nr:GNAT family protein [Rhodococcus sp. 14-2483-1-2]OZF26168.1 hypothetical protein CH295_26480 [Rhodococcus sp. 14-2483-1-2]
MPGDFADVHAFASDPVVCLHQAWGPNTVEDTHEFLDDAVAVVDGRYQLAILSGGVVVGSAAVWTTSTVHGTGELGFTLHRDFWGRGYGTLVAQELVRLGFHRLGLERVAATCRPENIGSARVLEKSGFRREGHLRDAVVIRGIRQDSLVFGQRAADYPGPLSP